MAGWLAGGYDNRVEINTDPTKIGATLTDFPVMLSIGNSSGLTGTDLTALTLDLVSTTNRKKIAVTSDDGTTQLYVEIAYEDIANDKLFLHVKVPTVSSSVATTLYIYWDSTLTVADNTTYVGDTGDAPAQAVWDSDFQQVMHMSQDSDVAICVDSSSNSVDADKSVTQQDNDYVDGIGGKAQDMTQTDSDYLSFSKSTASGRNQSNITLEIVHKPENSFTGLNQLMYEERSGNVNYNRIVMYRAPANGKVIFSARETDTGSNITATNDTLPQAGVSYYMTGRVNGTDNQISSIVNADIETNNLTFGTFANTEPAAEIRLQQRDWSGAELEAPGDYAEYRFSTVARSDSWVNATYYTLFDTLLNYGSVQAAPLFVITPWLTGYDNRVQITIPAAKVGTELTDFPVYIGIGAAVGIDSTDLSAIIDDLGMDTATPDTTYRKKIAVTGDDGETQQYVEIDHIKQDSFGIHSKVPTISSSQDTTLYLYWDSTLTVDDNTYVGDLGSASAQAVWDEDYVLVYNFAPAEPGTDSIVDSTSNGNHGTPSNFSIGDFTDGETGDALDFNGSSQYITVPDHATLQFGTGAFAFTAYLYPHEIDFGMADQGTIISKDYNGYESHYYRNDRQDFLPYASGRPGLLRAVKNTWQSTGVYRDATGTQATLLNGVFGTTDSDQANISKIGQDLLVGNRPSQNFHYNGLMSSIRLSKGDRSTAHLQVTGYTIKDELLSFQLPVGVPTYEDEWLVGWESGKRAIIEIDGSKVDEVLENFPVHIPVGSSVGLISTDLEEMIEDLNGTVGDTFTGANGSAPDTDKWVIYSGDAEIQSNKLYDTLISGYEFSRVRSLFTMDGDFDIEIGWECDIEDISNGEMGLKLSPDSTDLDSVGTDRIEVGFRYDAGVKKYHIYNLKYGAGLVYGPDTLANPNSGKFRVVRVGDSMSFYYDISDSGWTLIGTSISVAGYGNSLYVYPFWNSQNSNPDVTGSFDNFVVNSGCTSFDIADPGNRKKIAITNQNGDQQYVEIDYYNFTCKNMNLHTKVGWISSVGYTRLYLYWDEEHVSNNTYVGDTGDSPAQSVWDADFDSVLHLAQDVPNMLDSTDNSNDCALDGNMDSSNSVVGNVGKAIDFDTEDEFGSYGNILDFLYTGEKSFEFYVNPDAVDVADQYLLSKYDSSASEGYDVRIVYDELKFQYAETYPTSHRLSKSVDLNILAGEYVVLSCTYNNKVIKLFKDGVMSTNTDETDNLSGSASTTEDLLLGGVDNANPLSFFGLVDEARISAIERSPTWVKATSHTLHDTLLYIDDATQGTPIVPPWTPDDGDITGPNSDEDGHAGYFAFVGDLPVDSDYEVWYDLPLFNHQDTSWGSVSELFDQAIAWSITTDAIQDTSWKIIEEALAQAIAWNIHFDLLQNTSWNTYPAAIGYIQMFCLKWVRYEFGIVDDNLDKCTRPDHQLKTVQYDFDIKEPIQYNFKVTRVYNDNIYVIPNKLET